MADADTPGLPCVPGLRQALQDLARELGTPLPPGPDDSHAPWEVYRAALRSETARPLLPAAVRAEPDGALASGVVGEVLELLPRPERDTWVAALPPAVRAFSERRARELAILDDLRAEAPALVPEVTDWSDWLQLRAAIEVRHPGVLNALADSGRTKRIRRTARESLG
ncbi:hypothetical protein [Streptomyces sp. NPDC046887]|uniref:hypothetical protein n=1 Tax=Streptomyces sp. NPDC046887 TaxID=3155472 RepID=UPI0033F8FA17